MAYIRFLTIILLVAWFLELPSAGAAQPDLMQSQIKHVVILMMENRSFDNMLAWLYENDEPDHFIPGYAERKYYGLAGLDLNQYTNVLKDPAGNVIYSCAPLKGVPSVSDCDLLNSPQFDPYEEFPHVTHQIFGSGTEANMLGFLQDFASKWDENDWIAQKKEICAVMETYTEREMPVLHTLAKQYGVSDYWFSSVPTQTNPNRAFLFCGTSEGEVVNAPLAANVFFSDTVFNRLYEHTPDTTWGIFWQGDQVPEVFPGPFSGTNVFAGLRRINKVENHIHKFDKFHELARKGELPEISFLEPLWTISVNFTPKSYEISELVSKTQEWVLGLQGNDLHPPGDVRTGENLLANVYTSLISNPEAWAHTLLIITFDEHGGLFDHMAPPAAIPPDGYCQNDFKFDRFGVRVPAIFISPLINKRTVIRPDDPKTPFDHTSIIAMILKWKNIKKDDWKLGERVNAAPTFENAITRTDPRQDSILVDPVRSLSKPDDANVIKLNERFYLKDVNGNYLTISRPSSKFFHLLSSDEKLALQFVTGSGEVTHGSFAIIQGEDAMLGKANILEPSIDQYTCSFEENNHSPDQWWTIKSVDHPYLGAPIHYGDKIYLENHFYLDLVDFVPCRLAHSKGLFRLDLIIQSILDDGAQDNYWTIEKA